MEQGTQEMTEEQKASQLAAVLDLAPTLYHFAPDDKRYLGASRAELDPLEWEVNGVVRWQVPARCSDVAPPPTQEGQVAVFDEEAGAWRVVLEVALEQAPGETLTLDQQIAMACHNIDRSVDEFIFRVIGNRAVEYLMAEQDAQAFKARGYPEDVPVSILADMEAFGRTAQEATDAILAQASAWRSTLKALRGGRLKAKQDARKAASVDDLAFVLDGWQEMIDDLWGAV